MVFQHFLFNPRVLGRGSQEGGGIGRGDHFLPHKFIERTFERRANYTKQLLMASRGHQAPRKAAHCLQKEVGQNIKDNPRVLKLYEDFLYKGLFSFTVLGTQWTF